MITNDSKEWWELHKDFIVKTLDQIDIGYFINLFIQDCIKKKKTLLPYTANGFFKTKKQYKTFLEFIDSTNPTKLVEGESAYDENSIFHTFVTSSSLFQYTLTNQELECNVNYYGSDPKELENFKKLCAPLKVGRSRSDHIYIMIQRETGVRLHSMGMAAKPLIESNYSQTVLDKFKTTVKELSSPDPLGRLVIMDGIPGTGKSYLVRSLIKECAESTWIFIPAEMVAGLSGPSLIPVLLEEKDGEKPIILVIEDADECLTKRNVGNLSAISTLLNASSGMLGDMIDIRVVCTTNTPAGELDEAVLRDCRLLERIEVTALDGEEAAKAYKGISASEAPDGMFTKNGSYTLANVYALAKKGSSNQKPANKKKTGFV